MCVFKYIYMYIYLYIIKIIFSTCLVSQPHSGFLATN